LDYIDGMNTSRTYHLAIFVTLLAFALHLYEAFFKSTSLSIAWALWPMLPYVLCLGVWLRSRVGLPALLGTLVALAVDFYTYYTVFIHPTSSTDALAMAAMPLYSTLVFCPVVMLLAWLVARKRQG
jgi:hypothetical protein